VSGVWSRGGCVAYVRTRTDRRRRESFERTGLCVEWNAVHLRACSPLSGTHVHTSKGDVMSIARVTEITSASNQSFEDAIRQGISRASKTLEQIQGAWVKEQKIVCDGATIKEYRVTMKVTFVLKE
jgi:flavin-binding protein dodecin